MEPLLSRLALCRGQTWLRRCLDGGTAPEREIDERTGDTKHQNDPGEPSGPTPCDAEQSIDRVLTEAGQREPKRRSAVQQRQRPAGERDLEIVMAIAARISERGNPGRIEGCTSDLRANERRFSFCRTPRLVGKASEGDARRAQPRVVFRSV